MVYTDVEQEQKGVQLMRPEDEQPPSGTDLHGREVRVVQWFGVDEHEGPLFPVPGVWNRIPMGRSVLAQTQDGGQVLLSRMRVRPLQGDASVCPPPGLQRRLWQRLAAVDNAVAQELGHVAPGGGTQASDVGDAIQGHGQNHGQGGQHVDERGSGVAEDGGREPASAAEDSSTPSEISVEEVVSLPPVSDGWYEEVD